MSNDDDLLDFVPTGKELPKDLFSLTLSQLRQLAKAKNVSVSGTRKADIVFMLQEAGVTSSEGVELSDDVEPEITKPSKKERPISPKGSNPIEIGKIAIYSERNRFNSEFGRIERGYNIVSVNAKDFWVKFDGVREATPKEVAKYYGVK
jgi:hypothetical protein